MLKVTSLSNKLFKLRPIFSCNITSPSLSDTVSIITEVIAERSRAQVIFLE